MSIFDLTVTEKQILSKINQLDPDGILDDHNKRIENVLFSSINQGDYSDPDAYLMFFIKLSYHHQQIHTFCTYYPAMQSIWRQQLDDLTGTLPHPHTFLPCKSHSLFEQLAGYFLYDLFLTRITLPINNDQKTICSIAIEYFYSIHAAIVWADAFFANTWNASTDYAALLADEQSELNHLLRYYPGLIAHHGIPACLLAALTYNGLSHRLSRQANDMIRMCRKEAFMQLQEAYNLYQAGISMNELWNTDLGNNRFLSGNIEKAFGLKTGAFSIAGLFKFYIQTELPLDVIHGEQEFAK